MTNGAEILKHRLTRDTKYPKSLTMPKYLSALFLTHSKFEKYVAIIWFLRPGRTLIIWTGLFDTRIILGWTCNCDNYKSLFTLLNKYFLLFKFQDPSCDVCVSKLCLNHALCVKIYGQVTNLLV